MGAIPYALSVQHFISSVGADAGFAAIVGLAILILLYFAQARETASLRDRADESAEQVQALELRLAQLSRSQAAPAAVPGTITPAPAPPGIRRSTVAPARAGVAAAAGIAASRVVSPAPVPVGAVPPSAPAGVGAPALSAATRLIPESDHDRISISANGAGERGPGASAPVMTPPGPPPATTAGGATGAVAATPAPAAVRPTTAPPRRSTMPPLRSTMPPLRPPADPNPRSRLSRALLPLLGAVVVIAVVGVLLIVTSGGAGTTSPATSSSAARTTSAKAPRHRRGPSVAAPALTPAAVTVAVLNGTSVTNLAHDTAAQLGTAGFKEGTIATASDQTETATVVGYLPGHRAAALLVARQLKLGSASIQPVSQSNLAVACPASTPCTAQVVVTVGTDLASNA